MYGERVQIDWPLNHPASPTSGRKCFEHKILHFDADPLKPGLVGNDDEVGFFVLAFAAGGQKLSLHNYRFILIRKVLLNGTDSGI